MIVQVLEVETPTKKESTRQDDRKTQEKPARLVWKGETTDDHQRDIHRDIQHGYYIQKLSQLKRMWMIQRISYDPDQNKWIISSRSNSGSWLLDTTELKKLSQNQRFHMRQYITSNHQRHNKQQDPIARIRIWPVCARSLRGKLPTPQRASTNLTQTIITHWRSEN